MWFIWLIWPQIYRKWCLFCCFIIFFIKESIPLIEVWLFLFLIANLVFLLVFKILFNIRCFVVFRAKNKTSHSQKHLHIPSVFLFEDLYIKNISKIVSFFLIWRPLPNDLDSNLCWAKLWSQDQNLVTEIKNTKLLKILTTCCRNLSTKKHNLQTNKISMIPKRKESGKQDSKIYVKLQMRGLYLI